MGRTGGEGTFGHTVVLDATCLARGASPVVCHTSIRVLLAFIALFDFELEQLDVKTTFLHGELEEEIYMRQSEGFVVPGKEHSACRLKKSLYGRKQAPKLW